MTKILAFIKKETVLSAAWLLALISMFLVPPSASYIEYIDFRSLGILWGLMVIMEGLKSHGFFESIGRALLARTAKIWQLAAALVFLCFFFSMFITNDVALLTFVPFAIYTLEECHREDLMIPVIAFQTLAANLGSMLTPMGNPQNLYLYGISGMGMGEFILLLLPYSLATAVLLVISIALLKGKSDAVILREEDDDTASFTKKDHRIITVYQLLFLFALLVVAHIVPYTVLILAVLVIIAVLDRKSLITIDYALLFTFVGFFVFTGNMGTLPAVSRALTTLVGGHEVPAGILTSQVISNVPAALLLSGFTENLRALILGVNFGGLGTLIASMASLISFKFLAHSHNEKKGAYLIYFTVINLVYLAILVGLWMVIG